MVKARGIIELRCMKPNGVKCIQDSFASAKKSEKTRGSKIEFYVIASPKYGVEVAADNWKRAEELLQKVGHGVVTNVTKAGGQGSFRRDK
jgi:translation initiation factor 2 alpha subunit (eIF-2alpha)